MRPGWLVALGVVLGLATISPARASDAVRACIDASTAGQTLRQQGRLLEARDRMIVCAQDACPTVVRSHCARWLGEIDNRIPSVIVRVQDPRDTDVLDARLAIDGKPRPLDGRAVPLDPGQHLVAIDRGAQHQEERVILVEGEASRLVMLRLGSGAAVVALPEAPSSRRATHVPLGAWILGATGIATLGVATYFGLAANQQLQDLKSSCSPHCTDAQTRPGRADSVVFDTLLGVGGAGLAVAVVWALAFPAASGVAVQPVARGAVASFTLRY